jgi:hypothetical protein
VEQWSTEAPEVSNTKKNRSLEGHNETKQAATDDKDEGTDHTEETVKTGRNYEEEYVPTEETTNSSPGGELTLKIPEDIDIDEGTDERKHDKPLDDDNAPVDNADYRPNTGADNKPNEQASEVKDEVKADYKPDTGANDRSTESGVPAEELIKEVVDARTHDWEYASEQVPTPTHQDNKMTFEKALDGGNSDTT